MGAIVAFGRPRDMDPPRSPLSTPWNEDIIPIARPRGDKNFEWRAYIRAVREEMKFQDGQITNAAFAKYMVPRFDDVPELDIHLLDRPDLPSAGAGETPIIAIAPAIANAVFQAAGQRIRQMPIKLAPAT